MDLRQIGMALLVSQKDQFPLFHDIYRGNKNDVTVFKDVLGDMTARIRGLTQGLTDITIVFDKGNNSKNNFAMLDKEKNIHYVGGLVSSHFMNLIEEANRNFSTLKIEDEEAPVYRIKREIWGEQRTCVITVSKQLKEGQIQGIEQHLQKKFKRLAKFKQQLENPKRKKIFQTKEVEETLKKISTGQFINSILKYKLFSFSNGSVSFTYFIDEEAYQNLTDRILGRKIVVTNQHDWTSEEILLAYRGQAKVEYAFRNLKNPLHLAIRPQYHWTDQKLRVHFLICILGYLLTVAAYSKARAAKYKRNISHFLNDLRTIRLACVKKKKSNQLTFQLEPVNPELIAVAHALTISNQTIKIKLNISDYI